MLADNLCRVSGLPYQAEPRMRAKCHNTGGSSVGSPWPGAPAATPGSVSVPVSLGLGTEAGRLEVGAPAADKGNGPRQGNATEHPLTAKAQWVSKYVILSTRIISCYRY